MLSQPGSVWERSHCCVRRVVGLEPVPNLADGFINMVHPRREGGIEALFAACCVHEKKPGCRHHYGRTDPSVNQPKAEIDPCHNTARRNDVSIIDD